MRKGLRDFVAESWRIEGIERVLASEITAHEEFLALPEVRVPEVQCFVRDITGAELREKAGMDVRVGPHVAVGGGPGVRADLEGLLIAISCFEVDAWTAHVEYETLHPFTDGNGRSGRVLWAWQQLQEGRDPFALPFLHRVYYDALDWGRQRL